MNNRAWITDVLACQGVRHAFVGEPFDAMAVSPSDKMIVFWSDARPLGHLFVSPDEHPPHGELVEAVARIRLEEKAAPVPKLNASVVICTRDRPDQLQRCLLSLPQQTYVPREVIVVDNASRDMRTREVAEQANVTYIREDRPGLDIARNTGALRASADIVAYTDDDVLLHPQWLERLVAAFDAPQVAAVTGLVLPGELATEAQFHFERYWSFGQGYQRFDHDAQEFAKSNGSVYPAWKVGAGASMAFRRELFDKIGFFDERLDVGQAGCSGDSEFWYRLLANGYTCRYEPASIAFHFHRRTIDGLAGQIYHYMRGHAAALLVQHERTGIRANLRRALLGMPHWYARRVLRRLAGARAPADRFLKEEITGYLAGLLFYWRTRRSYAAQT